MFVSCRTYDFVLPPPPPSDRKKKKKKKKVATYADGSRDLHHALGRGRGQCPTIRRPAHGTPLTMYMGARSLLLVLISLSILYKTNKLSIVSFGIIYTKINNKT